MWDLGFYNSSIVCWTCYCCPNRIKKSQFCVGSFTSQFLLLSPYSQSTNFSSLSLILCACSWLRRALIFNFQSLRSNYSYFFFVHHQSGFFLGGFVELKWRKRNTETCTSLCGDRSQLPFLTIKIPKPTNFLPIFSARRL